MGFCHRGRDNMQPSAPARSVSLSPDDPAAARRSCGPPLRSALHRLRLFATLGMHKMFPVRKDATDIMRDVKRPTCPSGVFICMHDGPLLSGKGGAKLADV